MAYDEVLAERIRGAISGVEGVQEMAMFGGLGFLVGGHMAVAAAGKAGLMARVDPAETDSLITRPGVEPFEMRGRGMTGWLLVAEDALDDEADLREWVDRGVAYVATLPPKPRKAKKG